MIRITSVAAGIAMVTVLSTQGFCAVTKVKPTLNKTDQYISDGVFQGGDLALEQSQVLNIRRGAPVTGGNGYERVVIDLDVNQKGAPAAVLRPPYYEVAVMPEQNRVQVTLRGNPVPKELEAAIRARFGKPGLFKSIQLLPKVEDNLWMFTLGIADGVQVEVFEQPFSSGSAPVRIVLDARKGKLGPKVTESTD